ncbi:TetR/AcrR family transcriptional regulator [Calothrix sp. UHCC 0171]|uniref:TetR/AcrR family transcriptional regulator n=1 Tax=Calothrix sp. UHCC 0171 TaxID=3110245 RepID=UPI002B1F36DC|nr:TetR/AcrR family transcriptional regulator [Calothrix sp. UHCC 0171]MEA5571746.1 TetR/AcrR family transcriptional regulator [Calothrix sp. UHCC 0171]
MENLVSRTAQTRARLLAAATEVFANAGLAGATTREIARVAGVNEVTLFRHFQNKEQLLAAVIQQAIALQAEALDNQDEWTQDLDTDLSHYACLYNQMLEEHEALIRTFIGEAKRHPDAARQILHDACQSLNEKLVAYLQKGQEKGTVRLDIDLKPAVDMFIGTLLSGMLRRTATPTTLGYSTESYIETCVNLFVGAISVLPININRSSSRD